MRTDGICPPRVFLVFGIVLAATGLLECWPLGLSPNGTLTVGAERRQPRQTFSAEERAHWSFQPVHRSPVPRVGAASRVRTPIDAFVLSKLEERGLGFSPPADRRELIRRVTFDLLGLPPSPAEVEAFVADRSSGAYSKVVDRLLASPSYGERWGRHWLDVVRYADTAGETADYPVPQARLYRDYVIDSFNKDKPYDEFLREQVEGDLLAAAGPPERYAERMIATGFIA